MDEEGDTGGKDGKGKPLTLSDTGPYVVIGLLEALAHHAGNGIQHTNEPGKEPGGGIFESQEHNDEHSKQQQTSEGGSSFGTTPIHYLNCAVLEKTNMQRNRKVLTHMQEK